MGSPTTNGPDSPSQGPKKNGGQSGQKRGKECKECRADGKARPRPNVGMGSALKDEQRQDDDGNNERPGKRSRAARDVSASNFGIRRCAI